MELRKMQDVPMRGARVLVRVDFNVPMMSGLVADDTRIRESIPTIVRLIRGGASVALASHIGRPKGKFVNELSLSPVVPVLSKLLNSELRERSLPSIKVGFLDDCVGFKTLLALENSAGRSVTLLENIRFHREETKNGRFFAMSLGTLCTHFVNDAFGSCHRAHASIEGIAHLRPSYAGLLVQKEVEALGKVTENPERPFHVILGGAKIAGKLDVLSRMTELADSILIGGAMAFTFALAQGLETGRSLVDEERIDAAKAVLENAARHGTSILLPADVVVTDSIESQKRIETKPFDGLAPDDIGVDIGATAIERYTEELSKAKTVFWNGPMGVFEIEEFAEGTDAIARALAEIEAATIVGGGESAMAVKKAGVLDKITHVSTGGGASLEFVEGKDLPGIKILEESNEENPAFHV